MALAYMQVHQPRCRQHLHKCCLLFQEAPNGTVFNDLRLAYKILLPVSFLLIAVGLILWNAKDGLSELQKAASTIVERTVARQALVLAAVGDINEASLLEKNIILSSEQAEMRAYQERYKASFTKVFASTDRLIALSNAPEQRRAIQF